MYMYTCVIHVLFQMMSDDSGGNKRQVAAVDEVHNSYGVQMTSHPLMLITIKGTKTHTNKSY